LTPENTPSVPIELKAKCAQASENLCSSRQSNHDFTVSSLASSNSVKALRFSYLYIFSVCADYIATWSLTKAGRVQGDKNPVKGEDKQKLSVTIKFGLMKVKVKKQTIHNYNYYLKSHNDSSSSSSNSFVVNVLA